MVDSKLSHEAVFHSFAYGDQFSPQMDLPEHDKRHRTFLIASTPRCGSHFLGHGLIQLGVFGVPLEYLNIVNLRGWKIRFGPEKSLPELLTDIVRHRTSPSGWFGVKAHWSQFSPRVHSGALAPIEPIERTIFLYRRDLLGQAISFLKAKQTGVWISGARKKGEAQYDFEKIVGCAKDISTQNRAWVRYLTGAAAMSAVYEDLIEDPVAMLGKVSRFLDADCAVQPTLPERTARQGDESSQAWRERFMAEAKPAHRWILQPQKFDVPSV